MSNTTTTSTTSTSRGRNWCFTINNPTNQLTFIDSTIKYAIWQKECPEEGTPHYQGYIEFKTLKSFTQVKGLLGETAHIELRRGTREQARDYCRKEDSRVAGPWEHGVFKSQGARTDLDKLAKRLKKKTFTEFAEENPSAIIKYSRGLKVLKTEYNKLERGTGFRVPKIFIFHGETGTGKTRKAYAMDPQLYKIPIHESGSLWFDGYDNQKTLLIDEFYGGIKYSLMLRLLDGYPLQVQYKGGFVTLNHEQVIITSNSSWEEWYPNVTNTDALRRRIDEFATIQYFSGDSITLADITDLECTEVLMSST